MLWALGFVTTFMVGGMTGVLLAVPAADFVLHNSLFLVAHFHNVIISGVLSGAFAGFTYWFPKAFGFRLHEAWGKAAFWTTLAGYMLVFVPLYFVGLLGMTRRLQHIDMDVWAPWLVVAAFGVLVMIAGAALQIMHWPFRSEIATNFAMRQATRGTGVRWNGQRRLLPRLQLCAAALRRG